MRYAGPNLAVELEFNESFDPSSLSKPELEHLSAFLGEVVRELVQQVEMDTTKE